MKKGIVSKDKKILDKDAYRKEFDAYKKTLNEVRGTSYYINTYIQPAIDELVADGDIEEGEAVIELLEEIADKNKKLQQELILLPADEKVKKLAEIKELEEAVKELQKKRFGVNGDLLKKRRELIEPIQDEIYKAIKELAKDKGYDFIMDKATNSNILFTNPKYDKSEELLKNIKQ